MISGGMMRSMSRVLFASSATARVVGRTPNANKRIIAAVCATRMKMGTRFSASISDVATIVNESWSPSRISLALSSSTTRSESCATGAAPSPASRDSASVRAAAVYACRAHASPREVASWSVLDGGRAQVCGAARRQTPENRSERCERVMMAASLLVEMRAKFASVASVSVRRLSELFLGSSHSHATRAAASLAASWQSTVAATS
eukprot:Amastigsp_a843976_41.p3 type:complete len:205 gc:universal Amastigsp_a843976_41:155-769(+)